MERFLATLLGGQAGPLEGAALVLAHRAWRTGPGQLPAIDRCLDARKLAQEPRDASRRAGRALLKLAPGLGATRTARTIEGLVRAGAMPGHHPIVLGAVTAELGIAEADGATLYAHGIALTVLGAAARLLPIGHLEIQIALARVRPAIEAAVTHSLGARTLDDLWSSAPHLEWLAMAHERGTARAFAT